MDFDLLLKLVARWVHILSATLAVGVPIYMRFVQLPVLETLDEETRSRVRESMAKRWRIWVYNLIVLFLLTGLYNFLVVARWRDFDAAAKSRYHMLFGIKFILALGVFFLLSALAGRSATLAGIRAKAGLWTNITILLGIGVVAVSGVMRVLP